MYVRSVRSQQDLPFHIFSVLSIHYFFVSDVSIEDFVSIINVELIVILVIISICKRGRKIV